jgi:hypothetical protein
VARAIFTLSTLNKEDFLSKLLSVPLAWSAILNSEGKAVMEPKVINLKKEDLPYG